jgi:hypothetical protein
MKSNGPTPFIYIETIDATALNEAIDVTVLKEKFCSNRATASNEKLHSN